MKNNVYIYIAVMALTSLVIRALPMVLLKKPIKSRFIKMFLYYVPYVTLSVMTFPAIMNATDDPLAGIIALVVGIVLSWKGVKLFGVAVSCCLVVMAFTYLPLLI